MIRDLRLVVSTPSLFESNRCNISFPLERPLHSSAARLFLHSPISSYSSSSLHLSIVTVTASLFLILQTLKCPSLLLSFSPRCPSSIAALTARPLLCSPAAVLHHRAGLPDNNWRCPRCPVMKISDFSLACCSPEKKQVVSHPASARLPPALSLSLPLFLGFQ